MSVEAVANAYREVLDQRVALMDAAADPALKQHFQHEIDVIKQTIAAMTGGTPAPLTGNQMPEGDRQNTPTLDLPKEAPGTEINARTEEAAPDEDLANGNLPDQPSAGQDGVQKRVADDIPASPSGSGGSALGPGLPAALEPYRDAIIAASEKTGVPANLIAAVAWKETRGNHDAYLSPSSAMGLMQVDPGTFNAGPDSLVARHSELAGGDLTDAATNVLAGAFELKDQYEQFGSWDLALRAYNSGASNVNPNDLSDITMDDGKVTGTANYVELVNAYQQIISTGNGQLVDNPTGMIPG